MVSEKDGTEVPEDDDIDVVFLGPSGVRRAWSRSGMSGEA